MEVRKRGQKERKKENPKLNIDTDLFFVLR